MNRRVRTYWLVRSRYRLAGNLATAAGASLGLALVAVSRHAAPAAALDPRTVAYALAVVAGAALLPRLLVRGLWRLQRGRLKGRVG